MKKLSLLLISALGLFCLSAQAQQIQAVHQQKLGICPFTDTFDLRGTNVTIASLSADGNLKIGFQKPNLTQFTSGCADDSAHNAGLIYLTATNGKGSCDLVINDGPYIMDPTIITYKCTDGLTVDKNFSHKFATYEYGIKFN